MQTTINNYQIEKGVPLPTNVTEGKWKVLGKAMRVGDSIFIAGETEQASGRRTAVYQALRKANPEFKFTSRTADGGFRIWRCK